MKVRTLLTIATAVALAVVGTIWIRSLVPPESPTGSLAFLSAAPELPIFDRSGKKIDLAKENGKFLIVHFWATWCPPCLEEIPALSRFWDKYGKRDDLVLYAVSVDKDWKVIDTFDAKNPNKIPVYRDPDAKTAARFGSSQYPETYIVNPAGRVLYRVQGAMSWDDAEVRNRIEQLLAS
ncbi:MAG TPA: TlpA disulfide reductase family protein [Thermoanaerobaculia bacterium]|nr:TlpA disulfide reductase family protein [Thermoanaerobaculia bacterium]